MPHHSVAALHVFVLSFQTLRFLSILSHSFLSIKSGMGANDIIDGGLGNDFIQDDHGDDTIIFKAGYGVDTISDAAGYNTIQLSGLDVSSATFSRSGNDLTISFGSDALVLMQYYDFYNFNINGTDVSALIQSLHGSDSADWLSISNTNGDSLYGEGGNDNLTGCPLPGKIDTKKHTKVE